MPGAPHLGTSLNMFHVESILYFPFVFEVSGFDVIHQPEIKRMNAIRLKLLRNEYYFLMPKCV